MVCDPYVEIGYWVLGYAEQELECVHGAGTRGFGGYSFTEEELREFARAARRQRITKQIKELERQLAIEYAWTETEFNGRYRPVVDEIRKLEQLKAQLAETAQRDRRQAIIDEIADLEQRLVGLKI